MTGEVLVLDGDELTTVEGDHRYQTSEDILHLFVNPDRSSSKGSDYVTEDVQEFYTDAPFPNYNDFDDMGVFLKRANDGVFARLLSLQIPMNTRLLEVGCGTGQLGNYLAATTASHVYATDMTLASLKLGVNFANENDIKGIKFIQMNLFHPCIRNESMDIVISIGVLHHTVDAKAAFLSIARLVKPGGYIIVGLYNRIGRLRTLLRRHLYKSFGESVLWLDPHLRKNLSPDKRRAWILDQYRHPQETTHTMSETLDWFTEAGLTFVSSIPKIIGTFSAEERLFEPQSPGTASGRFATEVDMLFSHYGGEGGVHVMIGQKAITP